jgi:ABC-type glutathione transport system ATPase component
LTDHADPRTCPSDLTSDLDEDSEADIIELLERLQRSDGFGFVLVPHNLEAAKHAPRIYLMQQGVLSATDLPEVVTAEHRPRHYVQVGKLWQEACR